MKIRYISKNTIDLISEMESDLMNVERIKALARLPEPSRDRRYRDVLINIYKETGFIYALVVIEFKDGFKKIYVFTGKALLDSGLRDYIDASIYTEGSLVIKSPEGIEHIVYSPYVFESARELFKKIGELGDKYRLSDYEVYLERIMEYIDFDTII